MDKFCDIQTRNELADFLKIPRNKLSYLLFIEGIDKQYRVFEIPKKRGGTRVICAPSEDLKGIQRQRRFQHIAKHWRRSGISVPPSPTALKKAKALLPTQNFTAISGLF